MIKNSSKEEESAAEQGQENVRVTRAAARRLAEYSEEDSIDRLVKNTNPPKMIRKKTKRTKQPRDGSKKDVEEEELPSETYKSTPLLKFSGTLLMKVNEEAVQEAPANINVDPDVKIISLVSSDEKKTPKKFSLCNTRSLEKEFEPEEPAESRETLENSSFNLIKYTKEYTPNNSEAESAKEDSDEEEEAGGEAPKNKTPRKSLEKKSVENDSPDSSDLFQNTTDSSDEEESEASAIIVDSDEQQQENTASGNISDVTEKQQQLKVPQNTSVLQQVLTPVSGKQLTVVLKMPEFMFQSVLHNLVEEESPESENADKEAAKEQIPAEVVEILIKEQKSKEVAAIVEQSVPIVQDGSSKRLPLSQIREPSTSNVKWKRPVNDEPGEKSPKYVMTSVGVFTVTDADSKENPFCVQDAKLVRKARKAKKIQRERKMKQKKRPQNNSEPIIFPLTIGWKSAGNSYVMEYVPETKVMNAGA